MKSYATTNLGLAVALINRGLKLSRVERVHDRQVSFLFDDPDGLASNCELEFQARMTRMPVQDVLTLSAFLRKQIYSALGWEVKRKAELKPLSDEERELARTNCPDELSHLDRLDSAINEVRAQIVYADIEKSKKGLYRVEGPSEAPMPVSQ